ncbi:MAG: cytochrome C oxidase subunit IV family protein [Novosphingobium sp.]|nr:cytochrome C oxidase subunit IV family protein [Novosphingobium sp.]
MKALLGNRFLPAWLLLIGLTLVSVGMGSAFAASAAVLAIAFAKVWIVMFAFMEVRRAPNWLRIACTAWLVTALAVLLAAYAGMWS